MVPYFEYKNMQKTVKKKKYWKSQGNLTVRKSGNHAYVTDCTMYCCDAECPVLIELPILG